MVDNLQKVLDGLRGMKADVLVQAREKLSPEEYAKFQEDIEVKKLDPVFADLEKVKNELFHQLRNAS